MNNQYKLLVLDIDGTILDKNGDLSETDFQAIQKVRTKGIGISLCTGRAAGSCKGILNKLSLDGVHVFCDGALICNADFNLEVYVKSIKSDLLKRTINKAAEYKLPLELYSSTNLFIEHETWITDIQRKFFGIYPRKVSFNSILDSERIIKGGLIISSPEEKERTRAFSRNFEEELYFSWAKTPAYPGTHFVNITASGVSKGVALEALTGYLGLKLDDVMAVGDGINDISLLSAAGLAIAMQNAPSELKSVSDYVTDNVEQSGVARAIEKFLL